MEKIYCEDCGYKKDIEGAPKSYQCDRYEHTRVIFGCGFDPKVCGCSKAVRRENEN